MVRHKIRTLTPEQLDTIHEYLSVADKGAAIGIYDKDTNGGPIFGKGVWAKLKRDFTKQQLDDLESLEVIFMLGETKV